MSRRTRSKNRSAYRDTIGSQVGATGSIGKAHGDYRIRTSKIGISDVLTPISDLDLMIKNGWGDTPQVRLPVDWRTRNK